MAQGGQYSYHLCRVQPFLLAVANCSSAPVAKTSQVGLIATHSYLFGVRRTTGRPIRSSHHHISASQKHS